MKWRLHPVCLGSCGTQIIYIILSITRAGGLIKFISHAVMTGTHRVLPDESGTCRGTHFTPAFILWGCCFAGFTSAAGLYIGISQLKFIFGVHIAGEFAKNYELFNYYRNHGIKQGSK